MGILSEGIVIVKKYHRDILLGFLGLLFILDIVTTTVALQRGNSEQNPFMIPLVQAPCPSPGDKGYCLYFPFCYFGKSIPCIDPYRITKKEVFTETFPPDRVRTGDSGTVCILFHFIFMWLHRMR